jgi:hypothetical protein
VVDASAISRSAEIDTAMVVDHLLDAGASPPGGQEQLQWYEEAEGTAGFWAPLLRRVELSGTRGGFRRNHGAER